MIGITLISVGTLKEGYLKEATDEYKKRLSQYAKVDEINIKEDMPKVAEAMQYLQSELERLRRNKYKCVQIVHGYGSTGKAEQYV